MFDLRYHVASLAAVFLMLVVGILIGVGISGRGFVDDAERNNFKPEIAGLEEQVDAANATADDFERRQQAAENFVESAYPALAAKRLDGKNIAILVLGPVDPTVSAVEREVEEDADGRVSRMRALELPLRLEAVEAALSAKPELGGYVGDDQLGNLGRDLGRELAAGGETPLWDALEARARRGARGRPRRPGRRRGRDAHRPSRRRARPRASSPASTRGSAAPACPVVGVEPTRVEQSAIPVFQRYRLSTVDGVDTPVGALAMLLVLADPAAAGRLRRPRHRRPDPAADRAAAAPRVAEPLTILIAARDEEARIGTTIEELRRQFPDAEVIVADDGSRDATAAVAEAAGARVVRLPHRGKGQALTLGERVAAEGDLLLCDADLRGDLRPLLDGDGDLTVAAFARRQGGGFGIAKQTARRLIRLTSGYEAREPLSGQRRLTQAARDAVFPLAAGFGCETAMTADAARAGLTVAEIAGRARAPRHRPRPARLPPPRPSAPRHPARVRPAGPEPPRPAAAARRLGRRRRAPERAAGRRDRRRRRPLERGGARLPRAPRAGLDDGRAQARRHPRVRALADALASPARSSSASPPTSSTSSTRSPAGR